MAGEYADYHKSIQRDRKEFITQTGVSMPQNSQKIVVIGSAQVEEVNFRDNNNHKHVETPLSATMYLDKLVVK